MTACAAWIPRVALVVFSIASALDVAAEPCKNHYILDGEPPCELVFSDVWTRAASIRTPRVRHTSVLLDDGKVMVLGGNGQIAGLPSDAEIYDPIDDRWHDAGPLGRPRADFTATKLADGRVLVVGGVVYGSEYAWEILSTAEIYDPVARTWTMAGRMAAPRSSHTATLLHDGTVLIAGGWSDDRAMATAEIYDPSTGTFASTGRMASARYGHTATLLRDGKVLAVRGSSEGDLFTTLKSAEVYDPATGRWTATMGLARGSVSHTASLLPDGRVLVAGGYPGGGPSPPPLAVAEIFDPESATWSRAADLQVRRWGHSAVVMADGRVLIAGGNGSSFGYLDLGSVEAFDPGTASWIGLRPLNAGRTSHTATVLRDGRVLVVGGEVISNRRASPVAVVEMYGELVSRRPAD